VKERGNVSRRGARRKVGVRRGERKRVRACGKGSEMIEKEKRGVLVEQEC
jgi:hypothetical protein